MITRPDEYGHTNPDLAIVDSTNVRGGKRVVQDLNELYLLSNIPDKLKEHVTVVRVIDKDLDYVLIDKSKANTAGGWKVNSSKAEVYVGDVEPTDMDIKIWGVIKSGSSDDFIDDATILRALRDANPNSSLATIWSDDKLTKDWFDGKKDTGAIFGDSPYISMLAYSASELGIILPPFNPDKCYFLLLNEPLDYSNFNFKELNNVIFISINGLNTNSLNLSNMEFLQYIGIRGFKSVNTSGCINLKFIDVGGTTEGELDLTGCEFIKNIDINNNEYTSIKGLVNNVIKTYNFKGNRFTPEYIEYLKSIGLNNNDYLLPQKQ